MALDPFEPLTDLSGRTALISGAATGIGCATAETLASAGAHVLLHCHPSQEATAEEVRAGIHRRGGKAETISADLTQRQEVTALMDRAVDLVGPIHILVNNAAVFPKGPFVDMSLEEWDELVAVNVTATFIMLRDAVRHMLSHHIAGRIVLVSSYNAMLSAPGMTLYAASKAAITMLGRGVAREVASDGIIVNVVAPAAIATSTNTQWADESGDQRGLDWFVPMGRMGRPDEVARAIRFLCSDEAQFITGSTLAVDGGVTTSKR